MYGALSPDMLATDLAYYLVRKGVRKKQIIWIRSIAQEMMMWWHQILVTYAENNTMQMYSTFLILGQIAKENCPLQSW